MTEYNSNFELHEAKSILPPADGLLRNKTKTKKNNEQKSKAKANKN